MYQLINLPFGASELEPVISAETIALHHGKHLATYVNNLNNLLPGSGMEDLTLEEIVTKATGGIFNNAGQILNHNLYFEQLQAPSDDNRPIGNIAQAIEEQFGSVDAFKEKFTVLEQSLLGNDTGVVFPDGHGTGNNHNGN